MATEFKLSFTGPEIDKKLSEVDMMVKSVNNVVPDENGNVMIEIPVTSVNSMTGDVVIDIPEQTQPNWDQNNSATLDYIKNRPFYTEDPTKVVIVEEETLTVGSDLYVECQFFPFEIGNTYFVTFNGTEYECVAWSDPNYEAGKTVCVGNGTFLGSDGYGDDLPFVIESYPVWGRATYLNVGETGDYILSVSETQSIVHQIDIKYVPHDDTKMDVENPVCTGTFSMNRQEDSPIGSRSFVEGSGGSASGICSHAEGLATIATGNYSHAQGLYNIEDTENKYAHIVGNGGGHLGVYTRSNAHTLDWNGLGWFAGGLKVGGTGQDDEAAVEVALKTDIPEIPVTSVNGQTGDVIIENNKQLTAMSSLITQELSGTLAIADLAGVITEQYQHINIYNDTKYHMIQIKYSGNPIGLFGYEGYISIHVKSYTDSNNIVFILSTDYSHYDVTVTNGNFNITIESYVDENEVLLKRNDVEYIPTTDYSPATKKYVDDSTVDKISAPSVMAVGQIIKVKTVDENGKPVEWEAVDPWVITSSTEGSTKKFKLTIDDDGVLTATEIVESAT
jgi:hypothetical protein